MMQYKVLDCVVYSILYLLQISHHLNTDKLGDFKDELDGLIIDRALFLGIKQYGFQYINNSGILTTKTVFAGVKRDSLTFDQLISLFNH